MSSKAFSAVSAISVVFEVLTRAGRHLQETSRLDDGRFVTLDNLDPVTPTIARGVRVEAARHVGSHHMQPREAIAKEFGVTRFADVDRRPRHNVAPSQIIETIISGNERLGRCAGASSSPPPRSRSLRRSTPGPRPCPSQRYAPVRVLFMK
jgi:hypothetical protein